MTTALQRRAATGGGAKILRALAAIFMVTCACIPDQANTGSQPAPSQPPRTLADLFKPRQSKTASNDRPSDVVRLICFYRGNPFMSFDREGDPDPEGFMFTLHLISRETSKGVLEDGTLNVRMFRVEPGRGEAKRTLLQEWTVETDDLVQASKPNPLSGMGYQPQFVWDKSKNDEILGRDVEIVAAFTTRDGRTVQSQTKSLRVPAQKGS